ncbi:MAG: cell surface protein SprA [Ignavibacteriales bacterium]|nr:cell surface protein SprA [Ignavibacteriales bacterium]
MPEKHTCSEAEWLVALVQYQKMQLSQPGKHLPSPGNQEDKQFSAESFNDLMNGFLPEGDSTLGTTNVPIVSDSISTGSAIIPKDSILVGTSKVAQDSIPLIPVTSVLSDSLIKPDLTVADSLKDTTWDSAHFLTKDTLKTALKIKLTKKDSLRILDSLQLDSMKYDSTARMAHLKYKRKDSPVLPFTVRKQSKFFTEPNNRVRTFKIDSTGKYVTMQEKIGEQNVKYPVKIPIDEFLALKIKSKEQETWDEIGYKYELKSSKKDLSNLLKDITDFEIPLPSVGVLSIFGAPKISLRINGSVDIHGAWRNETTEGVTASRLGNTRNEPDFRQQVQVNVSGTIGDKLQIDADWNTERTFEYENQLKIKYTGYEDEIVQSVEAGNVSLQTAPLVGGSEALFGIKAAFKLGPLNLTTIASQKKGEVKEKTLSGGSSSADFSVRTYNYSRNHFFLDAVYADTSENLNIFYNYHGNPTPLVNSEYIVKDIEVWKSVNQQTTNLQERSANAFINLPARGANNSYDDELRKVKDGVPGESFSGRFLPLVKDQDYILHKETGYISFKTSLQETDVIAVAYQFENTQPGTEDDNFYGEFIKTQTDSAKRLILKLIKPANLQPTNTQAWNLMLKNIYPIGVRNIKKEGFQLDIKYETPGEPVSILGEAKLLSAFGLDLTNTDVGGGGPDGVFDFKAGQTILPETGELIFPKLQPFGASIPKNLPQYDSLRYMEIYNNTVTQAQQDKNRDKFIITGKSTGEASSSYQLGFNIVENSVKVILNGRELTSGVDYAVDYTMGSLTIRNEAALVPGANLKITFEENDLFQLASKTLFGMRGMFDISRNTKLGFSLLTLSQQTLSDKVRIGEEPLSNTIYGLDFSTQHDLPFLTRYLDKLYSTREPSSITFRGEAALMNPDPNTKKSTVQSDNGESIAYIDDFEGSKRIIPVGISYTQWKDASPPIDSAGRSMRLQMDYKAKAFWYNILPSTVQVKKIWPKKTVATGEDMVTVLDFFYNPAKVGTYNYDPKIADDPRKNWGGMMKQLSSTANNLVDENIEFIEFWALVDKAPADAKLYLDLGRISEDVIPDGEWNREDKNGNDLIDEGEDNGLDGINNAEEATAHPGKTGPDPGGDDFSYTSSNSEDPSRYELINGTEGNAALTDVGRFPDSEDLNRNYVLDNVNSFFRYTIPLSTDAAVNPYLAGGSAETGWFLYRIPLKAFTNTVASPSLSVVETIRMFVTDVTDTVHIKFAEFNLVGNQWQRLSKADSAVLNLSVVNVEDNPDYVSPGGVDRERDRSRPDQSILKNEQSLNLEISNLKSGQSTQAIKYLARPIDLFNYSQMKIFIHTSPQQGPGSISFYQDANNYNAEVFFRFGTDSSHYYEYRQPVRENPADNNWNEMKVVFSELTALKQGREKIDSIYRVLVPGMDNHYYIVRGNPALTQIKYLAVGIAHKINAACYRGR